MVLTIPYRRLEPFLLFVFLMRKSFNNDGMRIGTYHAGQTFFQYKLITICIYERVYIHPPRCYNVSNI